MSSIEAVLRRNEAKFAITTQYYQYYQYHPIHSSFGTWLKNRQLPREARGQIGAEDISLLPGRSSSSQVVHQQNVTERRGRHRHRQRTGESVGTTRVLVFKLQPKLAT